MSSNQNQTQQESRQSSKPKEEFSMIMLETTRGMSPYRRAFSQFIHSKGVASASNFIGSTIGRPNALLAGALCSFILTLATYLLSKNLGYNLSGFEPIGAFILGWLAGLTFDAAQFVFKKK